MKPLFFALAAALAGAMWRWRRKLEPTLLIGGLIVIAGLVVYGSGAVEMPEWQQVIEDAGTTLGNWTYLVVAALAFLETGAFVGLLAPGETVMVFGGVIAGQGRIDLYTLIGITWAAAVAGDSVSFYLGRRLGRAFLVRHGPKFQITEQRLKHVEDFFERHGGKTILIGRFVGLVRAIAPFLAGSSGMRFRRFIPYDVIGAGLWATAFIVLGYIFWQSFEQIADYAEKGALALGSVIVVVVGLALAFRWLRDAGNRARLSAWISEQAQRPALRPVAKVARPIWHVTSGPRRFFVARITPGELGLEVTTLMAVVAVGSFAFISPILSLRDHPLSPADTRAHDVADRIGYPDWLVDLAKLVSQAGALRVVIPVMLLTTLYVLYRRRISEALALPAALALTVAAVNIAKPLEDRPRPADALVDVDGPGFPSGHAAYAIAWVAIAVVLTRSIPGFARPAIAVVAAIVLAAAIGLSRIYLRAHELSDVTAGAGLGAMLFAACAIVAVVTEHLRNNGARR